MCCSLFFFLKFKSHLVYDQTQDYDAVFQDFFSLWITLLYQKVHLDTWWQAFRGTS
jgi:hypothetical protein